jgi:hypothetical protein
MRVLAANTAVISVVLALGLIGCSQVSLHDALLQAEATANCSKSASRGTAALEARCLNAVDRPVWERHSPKTVDAYDVWLAKRMAIAKSYDRGEISAEEYRRGNFEALTTLRATLVQRETSEKAKPAEAVEVLVTGSTSVTDTPGR